MAEMISTILLTKNSRLNLLLNSYINELEDFKLLENFSDMSDLYNTISALSNSLLLVDMNDFDISLLESVITDAPNCKVVIIKENPDVDFIVKVVRAGVKDVLAYPIIKTEFLDMLERVKSAFEVNPVEQQKSKMISVFSNKGGVGKTSIASNLAYELAKITKENVALVDLNFQFGDISTVLDINPSFDISYMFKNLNILNKDFFLCTSEKYKNTSLYIFASPQYFSQSEQVSAKDIVKLFKILKESFSYIIVDTASNFEGKTIAALDLSDIVFLGTTVNLPALRSCQRCLDLFSKLGYDDEKVQIIVNRFMENDEITIQSAEKLLNKNIYWKIPNNYFAMMSSINKGVFVSEYNESANVAGSYKELAMHVSSCVFRTNLIKKFSSDSISRVENLFRS